MTHYYRSKSGKIVHYPDCFRRGQAVPWHWAEGKSNAFIARRMLELGVAPCRICCPPLFPPHSRLYVVREESA